MKITSIEEKKLKELYSKYSYMLDWKDSYGDEARIVCETLETVLTLLGINIIDLDSN